MLPLLAWLSTHVHTHTHTRHLVPCHPPTPIPHHSSYEKAISWVLRCVLFSMRVCVCVCVVSESMLCSCQKSVYLNYRAAQGARRRRRCLEDVEKVDTIRDLMCLLYLLLSNDSHIHQSPEGNSVHVHKSQLREKEREKPTQDSLCCRHFLVI